MSEFIDETGRRAFLRTQICTHVKVICREFGERITCTVDVSNVGLSLSCEGWEVPPVGSKLGVQVLGMPVEAPIMEMRIIRVENGVVALILEEFLH